MSLNLGEMLFLNTDLTCSEAYTQTHFLLSAVEVPVQEKLQRNIPISQAQDKGGSEIEGL